MDIQGFPNYLIYQDGRVWSKKSGKFLSSTDNGNGYKQISLYLNNKRTAPYIHRLIGIHYIPNPNNYPCIDHIDRNRSNNSIDNLRWVTYKMNYENQKKPKQYKTNTSGYTNIYYRTDNGKWRYISKNHNKQFNTKVEAIVYSFICKLKNNI